MNVKAILDEGLQNLSSAPLKPQQRLALLRSFLLPKLFFQLVLADCTKSTLRWLDKSVRSSVRRWLRLLKASRISKLALEEETKWTKPVMLGKNVIRNASEMKKAWSETLHRSCDGKGLSLSNAVSLSGWVTNGTSLLRGAMYIGCLQIRGNLLPTALRSARGGPNMNIWCDACKKPESLGHILQVCPRTCASRCKRHNSIVDLLHKNLKNKWKVTLEPRIPTSGGLRKPDIIVTSKDLETSWVVDVTVVADNADLDYAHSRKVMYYSCPEITSWIKDNLGSRVVKYSAVAANWRGAISMMSFEFLKNDLQLNKKVIELIPIRVLEGSFLSWLTFKRSSFTVWGINV